jgi:hypothetical protein
MTFFPGWDSIQSTTTIAHSLLITAVVVLALLVLSEGAALVYDTRKDDLVAERDDATNRQHDEEMARLRLDTANANAEAARLKWLLDQEIQKRAPRSLTDDQKAALLTELKGNIPEIALVVQNDIEAQAFSTQLFTIFSEAGAKMYAPEPPPADKWHAPSGLIMYSPLGQSEEQLAADVLCRALKRANLFGGTTSQPFASGQLHGPIPTLIAGYKGRVLYIGQKSPF